MKAVDTYMKSGFGFKLGLFNEITYHKKWGYVLLNNFEYEINLDEQMFNSAERHNFDTASNWLKPIR